MGVGRSGILIRVAFLIGLLMVNLPAQKRQILVGNPLSGPFPESPIEDNPKLQARRDPLRVDPARYHLELETDGMRVLRLTLGADEASLMHYSRDALVVCLSECHIRLTRPDGTFTDVHMEAGATRLLGSGMRSDKNLIGNPVDMLLIERKAIAETSK